MIVYSVRTVAEIEMTLCIIAGVHFLFHAVFEVFRQTHHGCETALERWIWLVDRWIETNYWSPLAGLRYCRPHGWFK